MAQEANIVIRLSDGKQAGETLKALKQDANRLTREIGLLKPGTDEFVKKSADLKAVGGRLKDVKDQAFGVKQANNLAVESFLQYIPFGPQLGALAKGFNTVTGSTNLWGMALKAIPIFALIGVITTLVSWFLKTQEAMDALTSITRPLQAVFQRLIGVGQELMSGVFGKLKDAINDPIGSLKELGQILLDNVINRFTAFGVIGKGIVKILKGEFADGFKELGNGVIQASTGVEDGIGKLTKAGSVMQEWVQDGLEAGSRLDQLQKEIERTEISLTQNRAVLNQKYQEAKEIAQDLSLSEAERMAAAKAAQAAQNSLMNQEQHFLDLKIEKMRLEHSLNDTSRADELELAKLEAERTNFAAQAAKKRASAKALENTVSSQIAAEEKKRLEDLQKYELDLMEEGLEKELQQLQIETLRKIDALTGSEEQIAEAKRILEEIQKEKENEIREAYHQEELEREESHRRALEDLQISIMDEGFDKELAALRAEHQRKITDLQGSEEEKSALKLLLTEQELLAENALREKYRKLQEEKDREERDQKIQGINEFTGNALALVQDFHQSQIDAQYKRVEAAKELYGEDSKEYKKAQDDLVKTKKEVGKKIKAAQISEAIINGIAEIAGYWRAYSGIPIAGPIIAAALAATAIGRTALNISKIKQQTFAKGGIIRGARHSQGGIPGYVSSTRKPIEMEDYEIILTRNVGLHPVGRAMASRLNEMFGGKKFATGGPVNPFSTPVSTGNIGSMDFTSSDMTETNKRIDDMTLELRLMRQEVSAWPHMLKVYNVLTETKEGIETLNRLEDGAGV